MSSRSYTSTLFNRAVQKSLDNVLNMTPLSHSDSFCFEVHDFECDYSEEPGRQSCEFSAGIESVTQLTVGKKKNPSSLKSV